MRTIESKCIESSLEGIPLFERGDNIYCFIAESGLVAEKSDGSKTVNTQLVLYLLKKHFLEESESLLVEALGELQEGDSISTLIIKVQDKQKLKWRPVRSRYYPNWKQLEMIDEIVVEQNGKSYGFNYMGIFACIGSSSYQGEEARANKDFIMDVFRHNSTTSAQFKLVKRVIEGLKIGDSIKTMSDNIKQERERISKEYKAKHSEDSIDRFITKISTPILERARDNPKKGTFDFIRVDVGIVEIWKGSRKEYICQNQKEITRRVLAKVEDSKQFQRIGVPINFLKISEITLTRDSILEYLFELKIK